MILSEALQLALVAQGPLVGAAEPGMWTLRGAVLVLCALTIALVAWNFLLLREPQVDVSARWMLLVAFLILSPLVYVLNFGLAVEGSKPVEFCNSCHVMNSWVEDLKDPESELLAAQHYQFRWIADHQCYTCHSDYGLFGDVGAKLDGLRHFWAYYLVGYEEPIKIRGTYDNQRCLFCHAPVAAYREIPEHEKNAAAIDASEQSCIGADCHVAPHPKPRAVKQARHE